MGLMYFKNDDIILSREDAWKIFKFFWENTNINPGSLTDQDRGFAQALLIEAIDKSYVKGFIEIIYKTFFMKVAPTFKDLGKMVREFAKKALIQWFKHATKEDLNDPKIYESVRVNIKRNFRSVWETRMQTGELIY